MRHTCAVSWNNSIRLGDVPLHGRAVGLAEHVDEGQETVL